MTPIPDAPMPIPPHSNPMIQLPSNTIMRRIWNWTGGFIQCTASLIGAIGGSYAIYRMINEIIGDEIRLEMIMSRRF